MYSAIRRGWNNPESTLTGCPFVMDHSPQVIYHLVSAGYYQQQPSDQPYTPENFAREGFVHCTAELALLVEIANTFFINLPDQLLVLEISPPHLTAPLKFEPPIPPAGTENTPGPDADVLFPHIYGPVNRDAIIDVYPLQQNESGRWQWNR